MTNDTLIAQPEATTECEAETAPASVSEDATPNEKEEGIEVKFNKQLRRLSLSEARDFAEKGMKYDSLIPVLNRLKELSPDGSMSLAQLADHLFEEKEKRASDAQEAEELFGRQNRLTAQFIELKTKFPEIGGIRDVPKSVIEQSLNGEIPLYYAYLGYCHEQEQKAKLAAQSSEKAKAATAGNLKDASDTLSSPEIAAMLKGIWA